MEYENRTTGLYHYENTAFTYTHDLYDFNYSNHSNSNFTCPSIEMPLSNMVFMMLYAVVCIIGLMGNTLVIYVVLRFSNMQTVTNMYILNLAIADECFLIGIPFLIATMHMGDWIFGRVICKAFMVSTSITQFTSSIFLLIMSADRYIAICHHISSPKYRTPLVSRIVSMIAWVTSALIMLPIMLYGNIVEKYNGGFTCNVLWPESHGHLPGFSFTIYSLVLGFAAPLCFIMTFYCMVIKKLRNVAKKTNKVKGKRRSHRKVTKLVLTVITVYILCWLPYWISQVALISTPEKMCSTRLEVTIFLLVGCLGYSNSAINPILYAYLSDNFKKSFLKACTCTKSRDINAHLKLEHSVIPKRFRERNMSESQMTVANRCSNLFHETNTVTTITGLSNVSSRNPSPPSQRNGSMQNDNLTELPNLPS